MSLETLISENTAALNRVADLLEISNADRAKLIAGGGASGTTSAPASTGGSDSGMTVPDIKEAVKTEDMDGLKAMLKAEKDGKNRSTAVKAIEDAMSALAPEEGNEEATTSTDAGTAEANTAETSTSTAPAATDDKNAKPVPATVTGEQAKTAFGAWFGETDDDAERATRRAFVEQITSTLGGKISELDNDGCRKAIFYLRRQRAGLDVDFSAAYDFDGSPTQDAPAAEAAPAASEEDDLL